MTYQRAGELVGHGDRGGDGHGTVCAVTGPRRRGHLGDIARVTVGADTAVKRPKHRLDRAGRAGHGTLLGLETHLHYVQRGD